MQVFRQKHEAKITGVLSCFDRMLFRGYLPIMSGASMAQFLRERAGELREPEGSFLVDTGQRLKGHRKRLAAQAGRPFEYLGHAGVRMERRARELAERDVAEGLVCVFSNLEAFCRRIRSSIASRMRT